MNSARSSTPFGLVRSSVEVAPSKTDDDLEKNGARNLFVPEEDSENDDDDHEYHHAKCTWSLGLQESIYSKALLAPLVHRSPKCSINASIWLSATVLLLLNMTIQTVILFKVQSLTASKQSEVLGMLFGDYGLCHSRPSALVPIIPKLGAEDKYWDCGPLTPFILANTSIVDANHDGVWQKQEASEVAKDWGRKFQKVVQLPRAFDKFMAKARAGSMLAQKNLTEKQWETATAEFSVLPISWVTMEQQKLELCAIPDSRLCGNLEVRGILPQKFPDISNTEDRLLACENVIGDECPSYYGQVFKSYDAWASKLCGSADRAWNSELELMTTEFELAHKYRQAKEGGSKSGVGTPVFQTFVIIILLIWWMSIFTEWREIIDWWVVVLFLPIEQPGVPGYHRQSDDHLEVTALPLYLKVYTFLLNILPRTCIGIAVAFVGTDFLIGSDSYMDLILNSVALTFLIQIDEMLYLALMSQHEKEDIDTCGSIEVQNPAFSVFDTLVFNLPTPVLRAALLVGICTYFMVDSYTKKHGKYEMGSGLSCLCQAEGSNCMAAQFMGGFESVALAG